MKREGIKKYLLDTLEIEEDKQYVIYGTTPLADLYYDIIVENLSSESIDFFIDSSMKTLEYHLERPVIHINNLKNNIRNNQVYIIASITESQDVMIQNLLSYNVNPSNIICQIPYFRTDRLKEFLNYAERIYFYEEFHILNELDNWIEEMQYYLNIDSLKVTFVYSCKDLQAQEKYRGRKNIVINTCNKLPQNKNDIIFVRKLENIRSIENKYKNPIICIDDTFDIYTKAIMYMQIADICQEKVDTSKLYSDNFERLTKSIEKKRGILLCGNGPSLESGVNKHEKDISELIPLVCNNLYQVEHLIKKIKPSCYTVIDPNFFICEGSESLKGIVNYVNQNECYFIFPKKWERLIFDKYKIARNKAIGVEFTVENISIPTKDNIVFCASGTTVILTVGISLALGWNKDVYFMGCDGGNTKVNSKVWEYQKGVNTRYLNKILEKESLIGTGIVSVENTMKQTEASYCKLLDELIQRGINYYTLTHSNFNVLEKNYVETI